MVYLIHFDKPHANFRHYLGTSSGLELPADEDLFAAFPWMAERVRSGALVYHVARVWPDRGEDWQRRLRANLGGGHGASSLCPDCSGEKAYKKGVSERRPSKYPVTRKTSLNASEQAALCLRCPLADCVGAGNGGCLITVELRRRRSEYDGFRRAAVRQALKEAKVHNPHHQPKG